MLSAAKSSAALTAVSALDAKSQPVIQPLKSLASLNAAAAKTLSGAYADLFSSTTNLSAAANNATTHVSASTVTPFTLDLTGMKRALSTAPIEFSKAAAKGALVLAIPAPDGSLQRFKIVQTDLMDAATASKSKIGTYRGIGIDDATASIRIDTTILGLHAQVIAADDKSFMIDPYFSNDSTGTYVSYYKSNAISTDPFTCTVLDPKTGKVVDSDTAATLSAEKQKGKLTASDGDSVMVQPSITFGGTLKTYRFAVGTSSQYTSFWGGSTQAQAAIVVAVNRVDGVYETELGIRLSLVRNDGTLISQFGNTGSVINTSTSTFNNLIGSANYDAGHVFTTASGGVSYLGVVGGSQKGGSTTGLPSPTGDTFYIDYVAHEVGHEFGANHTFNTTGDSQRNASTAYEPGSGISIMAYAGIEGANDLAGHSIPYFHSASIDEIRALIGSIPSVGVATATGDVAPTVNAGVDYAIPTGTPFALTATGSDSDGDALTYDWQQRDLGAARALATADGGTGPLFTELAPSNSPTRTLPTLNSVLNGFVNTVAGGSGAAAANVLGAGSNTTTANLAERMYAAARTSNWRVIARDNRGGVTTDDMVLTVVNTGSAFAVTSNTFSAQSGGAALPVTWNVAGTTGSGINVANVKISISTNGGQTFNTLLASTPNDGSESITLPNITTTTARIKVEAVGNIFFDINNANFTINAVTTPNGTWTGLGDGVNWNNAANWTNNFIPDANTDVTINVAANPTIVVAGSQAAKTINSAEALNVTGSLAVTAASTFAAAVSVSGTLSDGGAAIFNAPLTLTGTIDGNGSATFNSTVVWAGGNMNGAGAATLATGATMTIGGSGLRTMNKPFIVNGTATVAQNSGTVLKLNSVSIAPAGSIDLTDNDLIVTSATAFATVKNYLVTARANGLWNATGGITTSLATTTAGAAVKPTGLGILSGTDYANALAINTSFDGLAYDPTDTLIKYTWNGDANFDGKVDANDYSRIDGAFVTQNNGGFVASWLTGDFNFDNKIDANDYSLIDAAFTQQTGLL